jgi:hypothetical protein
MMCARPHRRPETEAGLEERTKRTHAKVAARQPMCGM